LHYDLLDKATLTTITLRMKLLHINMHEQHLHKCIVKGVFYSLILHFFFLIIFYRNQQMTFIPDLEKYMETKQHNGFFSYL